jgi:chemotaxis signal transduction protein
VADAPFTWDEAEATAAQPVSEAAETRTFLTVEVGGSVFALDVASVHEVLDPRPVAPLPGADMAVLGTFDLRGKSVMVVDGGSVFDLARAAIGSEERFVVVAREGDPEGALIGVAVDRVHAVEDLDLTAFERPHGECGATHRSPVEAILRRGDEAVLKVDLMRSLQELGVLCA